MSKEPLHVRLGAALREVRRQAGLTQRMVADRVGCSLPSVKQAEGGLGGSAMFLRLAKALEHELSGQSFVKGDHPGAGLVMLRKRRHLGRRAVAELAGVSVPTIAALERGANVHFALLTQISIVMGARLRLRPIAEGAASYWTDTAASSVQSVWTSPPALLAKLYGVIGGEFSLDPCSPTSNRRVAPVRAKMYFTEADDGLAQEWFGTSVYCNPPYGSGIPLWMAKCRRSVDHGHVDFVISLVPARSDTRWWYDEIAGYADVFMLKGRLSFGNGKVPAPFPSALVCYGLNDELRISMKTAFSDDWHIPATKLRAAA